MALGAMTLRFWASPRDAGRRAGACIARIDTAAGDVLLAGDLSVAGERWWLGHSGQKAPVKVLVAGREGSRTSSSLPWVRALDPRWVVFSAGYRNPYHHPAVSVIRRYRRVGARMLETAGRGSLRFRWSGGDIEVFGARDVAPFWIEKMQLEPGS